MVHLVLLNERGEDWWPGITGPQLKLLSQAQCVENAAATFGTWNLTTTDEELPEDVPSVNMTSNAGSYFRRPRVVGPHADSFRRARREGPPAGRGSQLFVLAAPFQWGSCCGGPHDSVGSQDLHHRGRECLPDLPGKMQTCISP